MKKKIIFQLMGGQLEFGGIWLPAEPFGEGSSAESCSTFRGYKRLSKEPHFRIRSIEVWGVGDKPSLEKDEVSLFISYMLSLLFHALFFYRY